MKVDQALRYWQTEAGTLLSRPDRIRALAEGCEHDGDFFFWNTGSSVFHADVLAARGRPAGLEPYLTALRRELDRVRQQIEADLADRAFVSPQSRQFRLKYFVDRDAATTCPELQQMMAIFDDSDE